MNGFDRLKEQVKGELICNGLRFQKKYILKQEQFNI